MAAGNESVKQERMIQGVLLGVGEEGVSPVPGEVPIPLGRGGWIEAWDRYREFEELSFSLASPGTGISEFLCEWDSRLRRALASGCEYADSILAFKLLQKVANCDIGGSAVVGEEGIRQFLSSLSAPPGGTQHDLYMATLTYIYKSAVGSSEEVEAGGNLLKQEESMEMRHDNTTEVSDYLLESQLKTARENDAEDLEEKKFLVDSCGDTSREKSRKRGRSRSSAVVTNSAIGHKNVFSCDLCDYVTNLTGNIRRHKQSRHNVSVDYKCEVCDFVAVSKKQLNQHRSSEHDKVKNMCNICSYLAPSAYRLLRHNQLEHGAASFPCSRCSHVAVTAANLRIHHQVRHEVDGIVKHICDECGFASKQLATLKQHKLHVHEDIRLAPCDQCDYVARERNHLKIHKQIKHEGVRYPCEQCVYRATTASDLRKHVQMYHEGVRYPCTLCEYVATKKRNLKLHRQNKHEGVRYPCDQCDLLAVTPGILKRHKESVHQGIKYMCDQCDYVATQKPQLTKHQRTKHKLVMEGGGVGGDFLMSALSHPL